MIKVADKIWIGGYNAWVNTQVLNITAVLNVAQDLGCETGWPIIEYMQVGLIDGPGNPLITYCAAVAALAALVEKHQVLVYCHGGSRSAAVVTAYMCAISGRKWDDVFNMMNERAEIDIPPIHPIHKESFNKINWGFVRQLMEKQ